MTFAEVPDEAIGTNYVKNEEFENTSQSSGSNPVDAFFNELGFGITNPTSVEAVPETMSNTEVELSTHSSAT